MTSQEDALLLAKLFGDDKNTIPYRPKVARALGSVTSAILLQQIVYWWTSDGNDQAPFYKFKEPCTHRLYREGDSWCEETGLSRREFDHALAGIAIKKTQKLSLEDAKKAARNAEQPRPVLYWISADRVTYYTIDMDALLVLLRIAYPLTAESADSKSAKAPIGKGGKRRLVKAESAVTISETSSPETTTETSSKEPAPEGAVPSPEQRHLEKMRKRMGGDPFTVSQTCLAAQEGASGSWTIPAEAGGADPVGEEMLVAWHEAKGTDIRLASEKDKEQFRRALGKLAREMPGISPAQAAQVVRTLLDHNNPEWGWYTYSSPSVVKFQRDWKEIAMRLLSDPEGGGQSPASQTATDGFLRLLEKERAKKAAFPTYQRPAGASQPAPEPHETAAAAPAPPPRKKPKQWFELLVIPGQEQPAKEAQSNG